jgi:putative hydrolase of the HAD superfamily
LSVPEADPAAGVVFDIDDTLYLERDYVASGLAALEPTVHRRWGVAGFGAVAWAHFVAGRRGDIFDQALRELGIRPAAAEITALVRAYRSHRPAIRLAPDAREALLRLDRAGVPVAIISDGPLASQAAKVAALGLDRFAAAVLLTAWYREARFAKPHPRAYREVAARLGAGRLAYVADNPGKDFSAPRSLGWRTVRIRRPGGLHCTLSSGADVDHAMPDLGGLHEVLRLG